MNLNCRICGGKLDVKENASVCTCEYCGMTTTLPKVNEERIINLFNKANAYRLSNHFDMAMATYESILDEDSKNAEAHWGIVLCRYGVEYVYDEIKATHIPTCHRTQMSPIYTDPNFVATLEYADPIAKIEYEREAELIRKIQRDIIDISSKIEPYDVFICYKETDEFDNRTEDSSIAQDICTYLTNEGYKVFYSRITLRSMGGTEYEPYIYAALRSSKVMIAVGTKKEYYEAPWVKNEWGRFLVMQREDVEKKLIPCYCNMLIEELPTDFLNSETLDINTPTFMLDLLNSVKRVIKKEEKVNEKKTIEISVADTMSGNANALVKKGYIYLEDGDFDIAHQSFEKSLDLDPENGKAYWGIILTQIRCKNNDEAIKKGKPLTGFKEYSKALRFASDQDRNIYQEVETKINKNIETIKKKIKNLEIDEINKLGAKKEIETCESLLEKCEENIDKSIRELAEYEQRIKDKTQECEQALLPYIRKVETALKGTNRMMDELSKKNLLNDSEKNTYNKLIIDLEQVVVSEVREMEDVRIKHQSFLDLNELISKRDEVANKIKSENKKVASQTGIIKETINGLKKVKEKYEPAFPQISVGNYELANRLMGNYGRLSRLLDSIDANKA